jgi:hypothetical protein
MMLDLGIARNVLGGVAAAALQNIGGGASEGSRDEDPHVAVPKQLLAGYSITRPVGQLDLGVFTQVLKRQDWTSPAAGIEVGYGWIEGCTIVLRAGVRRPDASQRPVSLGAGLTVDRFTIEYAAQPFDGARAAHVFTFRWR